MENEGRAGCTGHGEVASNTAKAKSEGATFLSSPLIL